MDKDTSKVAYKDRVNETLAQIAQAKIALDATIMINNELLIALINFIVAIQEVI